MRSFIIIIVFCFISTFHVFSQNNVNIKSKIILTSNNDKFVSYDNSLTWKPMYNYSKLVFAKWATGEKQYSTNNGKTWKTYLEINSKENKEDLNVNVVYYNGKISIIFNSETQLTTNLKIFDITGNIIFNEQITITRGTNNIVRNLSNIHTGTYYMSFVMYPGTKIVYNFLVN